MEACGKRGFTSEKEARTELNYQRQGRIARTMRKNKVPQRVYKCNECGKFHLTSKKEAKQ